MSRYNAPHPWNLSPTEAIQLQKQLASQVIREDQFKQVHYVAGVDVGFEDDNQTTRAATQVDPLVQSSENAAPLDTSRLRFLSNPAELLEGFNPTGDRFALAVRISGPAAA